MKILSTEEARSVDHHTSKELGVSGETLMQKAGKAIVEKAKEMFAGSGSKRVIVLCGKGNNGGDGFTAAELLVKEGFDCKLISTVAQEEITGDAKIFHDRCINAGLRIVYEAVSDDFNLSDYDLILDGLLGTGIKGQVRPNTSEWIKAINSSNVSVLAIDIPSGVNGNSGQVSGIAVKSDATVTMGFLKQGIVIEPGASLAGEISVADIGYPKDAFDILQTDKKLINHTLAKQFLTPPPPDTYKHRQGKVLIIGGSKGYTGAGCLAAQGALRAGAGLVIAAVPASLNAIYESKLTEVITAPLSDGGSGHFRLDDVDIIEEKLEWCDALIIGPGLGTDDESLNFAEAVVKSSSKPMVIDADALRVFHGNLDVFSELKSDFVITPHHGEAAQLLNLEKEVVSSDPFNFAFDVWQKTGGTVVLKGAPTLVASGELISANVTGHRGLATGGSGDVLSGIIGSFMAQGLTPEVAARVGVLIHGEAADILLKKYGFRGLLAGDLLEVLPTVLSTYECN
jgi:NAD(P)H-hydrate epimerase|tara:strand:- start:2623 stop:4158 length:1536 start_codon:yes stop_codon:yes gene_type:complete